MAEVAGISLAAAQPGTGMVDTEHPGAVERGVRRRGRGRARTSGHQTARQQGDDRGANRRTRFSSTRSLLDRYVVRRVPRPLRPKAPTRCPSTEIDSRSGPKQH
jgi:hypothetical protein